MAFIDAEQIVGTTFCTIDRLSEEKNGSDALLLYFKYLKQSRIQKTNQSWSLDSFMIKGLPRGIDRFKNAKALLKKLGLIEVIQSRSLDGKISTWYVKTNFIIDETKVKQFTIEYELPTSGVKNQLVEFPLGGETTTNALSNKNKCLKNINKIYNENSISKNEELFNEWYNVYPRKEGKAKARILRNKIKGIDYLDIIKATKIYSIKNKGQDKKYIKHADTWLSQQCWESYLDFDGKELYDEMYETRTEDVDDPTYYGQGMKEKYKQFFGDDWEDKRRTDKNKVKEVKKQERALPHKSI